MLPGKEGSMNRNLKTSLDRFDAPTDEMIDTSDIPSLTEDFFASAKWRMPKDKVKVIVEVEPEVAQWFKSQGENYQQVLAEALRLFAQEHKK